MLQGEYTESQKDFIEIIDNSVYAVQQMLQYIRNDT